MCQAIKVSMLRELLAPLAYPAECASMSYRISVVPRGIGLELAGFSHKLPVLMEQVLEVLGSGNGLDDGALFLRTREKVFARGRATLGEADSGLCRCFGTTSSFGSRRRRTWCQSTRCSPSTARATSMKS